MDKKTESLFYIDISINQKQFVKELVDSGSNCYTTINEILSNKLVFPRIKLPRSLFLDDIIQNQKRIIYAIYFDINIYRYKQSCMFVYIIPGQTEEIILGKFWESSMKYKSSANLGYINIFAKDRTKTRYWNRALKSAEPIKIKRLQITEVNTVKLRSILKDILRDLQLRVGKVSINNIKKMLQSKIMIDLKKKFPKQYWL